MPIKMRSPIRCSGVVAKIVKRSKRNQQKLKVKIFADQYGRRSTQEPAAKEQTKERRAADHSRHKRRQLHGGRKLNNGVTNDAENITVGQVCAESERSNAAVKTVKR